MFAVVGFFVGTANNRIGTKWTMVRLLERLRSNCLLNSTGHRRDWICSLLSCFPLLQPYQKSRIRHFLRRFTRLLCRLSLVCSGSRYDGMYRYHMFRDIFANLTKISLTPQNLRKAEHLQSPGYCSTSEPSLAQLSAVVLTGLSKQDMSQMEPTQPSLCSKLSVLFYAAS
jgi:hypothetical protein